MQSLEQQQTEMIRGCCCGVYLYGFIALLVFFVAIPHILKLL